MDEGKRVELRRDRHVKEGQRSIMVFDTSEDQDIREEVASAMK